MAAKTEGAPVKGEAREPKGARMPLGGYMPMVGLRGELDRVFNRFFPEGWPRMSAGNLMDLDPFRAMGTMEMGGALQSAKVDIAETDFSNGVLQVKLPKTKEAKARQRKIPVKES